MMHEGKPLVSGMTVALSGKQTLGELGPLQSAEILSHGWWVGKGWAPVFTHTNSPKRGRRTCRGELASCLVSQQTYLGRL